MAAGNDPTAVVDIEEDVVKDLDAEELIENSDLSADDVAQAEEIADQKASKGRPAVTLTDYQKLIVTATARFLAFMICRQGGKTFAAALRIANKVMAHVLNYYVFSRSERQSGNAVAQVAVHLKAMEKALASKGKRIANKMKCTSQKLRYVRADDSAFIYRRLTIRLPNGAQVIGLPASPDTVVGISGPVYNDEFALHRDSRAIYARLFPIISRRKEYEMLITSTPRGIGNKFYDIMTSDEYEDIFCRIIVDIFDAVKQGLCLFDYNGDPITDDEGIERLRKALKDDEAWKEEYLVQFIEDVLNLLTYDMIGNCERQHNQDGEPYDILEMPEDFDPCKTNLTKKLDAYLKGGDLYLGFDQARHKDLSVIWVDEDWQEQLWQRAMIVMEKKDYEFQEAALWQFMRHPKLRRAAIDSTGLGERTAERTVTRFGDRAIAVNFASNLVDRNNTSHPAKVLLARIIMERHQDGLDRYPVRDIIRSDFHCVKRKRTGSPDQFTYFADHDETGHADIFTAKALSDFVAQEMKEYTGTPRGMRVGGEEEEKPTSRLRPDHSSDHQHQRGEFAGIGGGIM